MTPYDFLLVLLSFVFALAIGHVMTSAGRMLVNRDRVKFSGLLTLAMLNALINAYVSWLTMWSFRDTKGLGLYDYTIFFLSSVFIYLNCMATAPEPAEDGVIDMEAFFWAQRRFFYGSFAILILIFVAGAVVFLRTSQPQMFMAQAINNIPFFLGAVAACIWPDRRLQWAVGLALFAGLVWWAVAFASVF